MIDCPHCQFAYSAGHSVCPNCNQFKTPTLARKEHLQKSAAKRIHDGDRPDEVRDDLIAYDFSEEEANELVRLEASALARQNLARTLFRIAAAAVFLLSGLVCIALSILAFRVNSSVRFSDRALMFFGGLFLFALGLGAATSGGASPSTSDSPLLDYLTTLFRRLAAAPKHTAAAVGFACWRRQFEAFQRRCKSVPPQFAAETESAAFAAFVPLIHGKMIPTSAREVLSRVIAHDFPEEVYEEFPSFFGATECLFLQEHDPIGERAALVCECALEEIYAVLDEELNVSDVAVFSHDRMQREIARQQRDILRFKVDLSQVFRIANGPEINENILED